MIYLAALLSGFGGLLLEMVLVRRHGLLLGNTAAASALVVGVFVAGLGVGGLLVPRLPLARARPLACAALLYGAVALLALLGDLGLAWLPPLSWPLGVLVAAAVPGLPTLLMGVAFPLLFTGIAAGAARAGALIAANLAGSVVAAAVGGNWLVAELGMAWTVAIAAGGYSAAALALAFAARREPAPPTLPLPPVPALGAAAAHAFAAGAVLIGFEVFLLRRLPFFLEGFQPTLAGVLAACLLTSSLGAAVLPAPLHRLLGSRAAAAALLAGALATCVGLHERWVPDLVAGPAGSESGMHLRILLASAIAAGPACLLLGAVVPLSLAPFRHRETRGVLAGRLFFWQGLGALVGALLVGQGLPRLAPVAFFVVAPAALAAMALLPVAYRSWWARIGMLAVLVGCGLGWSGAGLPWAPGAPIRGSRHDRGAAWQPLAHRTDTVTTASVAYDRRRHSMMLFTDEFRTAETGPGYDYMKVLAHLPLLLHESPPRRVVVVALGTGTTLREVLAWPTVERVDGVELSSAVLALMHHFAGDGPLHSDHRADPITADRRLRLHVADGRRFLARQAAGSCDLITMEPLLPYAPGTVPLYTREFYALARRALAAGGLMVQWLPAQAMPERFFRTLLATFARSFEHHSVWLIDGQALLIGSQRPHLVAAAELQRRLQEAPAAVHERLHEAGLPQVEDIDLALVGDDALAVVGQAPDLRDDRPFLERIGYWSGPQRLGFLGDNLKLLAAIAERTASSAASPRSRRLRALASLETGRALRLAGADAPGREATEVGLALLARLRGDAPHSVLLHREQTLWLRDAVEAEVVRRQGRGAAALARAQLQRDPGSALLQACLALPDRPGDPPDLQQRAAAIERAAVIDPLLFDEAPAFLAVVRPTSPARSPLEDLDTLPVGSALAADLANDDRRSLAWRAAFPVRCALALVDLLRQRRLQPVEQRALRSVLDPLSLAQAITAVQSRGGALAAEVLPLWRDDLVMTEELRALTRGATADRLRLAERLGERREPLARQALADLLLDAELAVRTAAGVSLYRTFGGEIPYDPEWSEERRRQAAQQLR